MVNKKRRALLKGIAATTLLPENALSVSLKTIPEAAAEGGLASGASDGIAAISFREALLACTDAFYTASGYKPLEMFLLGHDVASSPEARAAQFTQLESEACSNIIKAQQSIAVLAKTKGASGKPLAELLSIAKETAGTDGDIASAKHYRKLHSLLAREGVTSAEWDEFMNAAFCEKADCMPANFSAEELYQSASQYLAGFHEGMGYHCKLFPGDYGEEMREYGKNFLRNLNVRFGVELETSAQPIEDAAMQAPGTKNPPINAALFAQDSNKTHTETQSAYEKLLDIEFGEHKWTGREKGWLPKKDTRGV